MSSLSPPATTPAATLPVILVAMACLACHHGSSPGSEQAPPGSEARSVAAVGDVLTREQIDRINAISMEQLIRGRFTGVEVVRRNGELMVQIRGGGEPILVLNGSTAASMRALWLLDPADVEQIEILKDTASAIYGIDGLHGVIRVTMRTR